MSFANEGLGSRPYRIYATTIFTESLNELSEAELLKMLENIREDEEKEEKKAFVKSLLEFKFKVKVE